MSDTEKGLSYRQLIEQIVTTKFAALEKKMCESLNEQFEEWGKEHVKQHEENDARAKRIEQFNRKHAAQVEKYLAGFNAILEKKL